MKAKDISILIADDNKEFSAVLTAFLRRDPCFKVCGVCHDGEEALNKIRQFRPDVIILDIVMPYLDGIEVLGRIKRMILDYDPRIIIFSAIGQDSYTAKAMELGADLYFVKPFNMNLLSERIKELVYMKPKPPIAKPGVGSSGKVEEELDESLLDAVLYEYGVPRRLKGYYYIKESVEMIIDNPGLRRRFTTDIYPAIALRHETKAENVERAIRNVIDVAFKNGFRNSSRNFEERLSGVQPRPTNSKFIEMVITAIQEKGTGNDSQE